MILPTELGSVVYWSDDTPTVAILTPEGWLEAGWDGYLSAASFEDRLDGVEWAYLACVTPTGITTTR